MSHLINVLFLEEIESIRVRFFDESDSALGSEFSGGLGAGLLHGDSHVEQLHRDVWIGHKLLLTALEELWADAESIEHLH